MPLRRMRLRLWLWLMAECEAHGAADTKLYHWLARRAMACNPWRKWA